MNSDDTTRLAFRTCPLCEATCGLEISVRDDAVVRIRGDRDDVFSCGFICPKGSTLKQLDADPDRVRQPLIKRDGKFEPATWDEAFAHIADNLVPLITEHGPNAVALYLGNPNVHTMSGPLYNRVLIRALRSRSLFSASTVDQMPKHVSCGLMFGHPDIIPVPDIDRTDYLLILGANPRASNGSLATAPDWPGRLDAIKERGGRVVVVDPRRSRTAKAADEHLFIQPGTDVYLLAAIGHVLFDEGLVDLGPAVDHIRGVDDVGAATEAFPPERVAAICGIDAATIRRLARELAAAEAAAVYGRIGTHTVRFGTLGAWLVDVLNALTGNLDRPGGVMFPRAAHEQPRPKRGWATGRWTSRIGGHPEVRGELPVAGLADEITTPGDGRVRALITVAGNPVLSTPHSERLDAALGQLDFMVSVDIYRNETTRHADVILPVPPALRRPHYDFAFGALAVHNVANYSPAVLPAEPVGEPEWRTLLRLAAVVSGMGPDADLDQFDDMVFAALVERGVGDPASAITGRDAAEIIAATDGDRGPERMLDYLVRVGPYGEGYGRNPDGLSLERLRHHPHGIDLGPLQPRIPEVLATPSGQVELAPEAIISDLARLQTELVGLESSASPRSGAMVLVGRRHLRSNNSWMHNVEVLVKGKERCTLQINPADAGRLGLAASDTARVTSSAGSIAAPIEITTDIMPGVVSLPHGWGHNLPGIELTVASRRPGVNSNVLAGDDIDPLSGNAVLNGIPVQVGPA